jgi:hypothetical protein
MATAAGSRGASRSRLRRISGALDNYISLQLSLIGACLWVLGAIVQLFEVAWTETGVWAVVLVLWGTTLIALGLGIYGIIWWSHRGSFR